MPRLRDPATALSELVTLRLSPLMLAALDDLAERLSADPVRGAGRPVSRQSAGRMALEAGIRTMIDASQPAPASPVALDVDALAVALFKRLGPMCARLDALEAADRKGPGPRRGSASYINKTWGVPDGRDP
jgi:hypothetical protein